MRAPSVLLAALAAAAGLPAVARADDPVVRFTTSIGAIDVQLLPGSAPRTVSNFLRYVSRKDYDGTFFHRSVSGFVIQGGGYRWVDGKAAPIAADPPVVNEPGVSNLRGTLAMAKTDGNPSSATNQWFFNEGDNSANLDQQNGGFTVFGRVTSADGLKVMDAIAALPTSQQDSPLDSLPVRSWTPGTPVTAENLVATSSVAVLPATSAATTPTSTTPTPTPPTRPKPVVVPVRPQPAPPFRISTYDLSAPRLQRSARVARATVYDLPGSTRLSATLQIGGRRATLRATAPAAGGKLRLSFRLGRAARATLRNPQVRTLLLSVVARPPGGRTSRAATRISVRRR